MNGNLDDSAKCIFVLTNLSSRAFLPFRQKKQPAMPPPGTASVAAGANASELRYRDTSRGAECYSKILRVLAEKKLRVRFFERYRLA